MPESLSLVPIKQLFIRQQHELAEWFGFEARNKYGIFDADNHQVGYAAEQNKGILGFLMRQFLGHWRPFSVHVFDANRELFLRAEHPFRIFFQRLEVFDAAGNFLGALQQRFSLLTKRFDVQNAQGQVILEVASPFWKIWTFPFVHNGETLATVAKKWSGGISELFTDRDNFLVEFQSPALSEAERKLVLAAALFIDLQYFENKAGD